MLAEQGVLVITLEVLATCPDLALICTHIQGAVVEPVLLIMAHQGQAVAEELGRLVRTTQHGVHHMVETLRYQA